MLATQGLVNKAVKLLDLIPRNYEGSVGASFDYDTTRERLHASGKSTSTAPMSKLSQVVYSTHTASASLSVSASVPHAYGCLLYGTINQQMQDATMMHSTVIPSSYDPYNVSSATAPIQSSVSTQLVYQLSAQMQYSSQYSNAGLYVGQQLLQLPYPPPLMSLQSLVLFYHSCLLPRHSHSHPRDMTSKVGTMHQN